VDEKLANKTGLYYRWGLTLRQWYQNCVVRTSWVTVLILPFAGITLWQIHRNKRLEKYNSYGNRQRFHTRSLNLCILHVRSWHKKFTISYKCDAKFTSKQRPRSIAHVKTKAYLFNRIYSQTLLYLSSCS
jgi:hypothetical protein